MATPRLGQAWKPTVHAIEVRPTIGTNPDKYENKPHEEPRAGWRQPIFRTSIAPAAARARASSERTTSLLPGCRNSEVPRSLPWVCAVPRRCSPVGVKPTPCADLRTAQGGNARADCTGEKVHRLVGWTHDLTRADVSAGCTNPGALNPLMQQIASHSRHRVGTGGELRDRLEESQSAAARRASVLQLAGAKCLAARRTQSGYRFAFHQDRTGIVQVIAIRALVRHILYHGGPQRLPTALRKLARSLGLTPIGRPLQGGNS